MKIYTKSGDKGQTSLLGGKRVDKDHFRIEAYGTVDELNSFMGILVSRLGADEKVCTLLRRIQNNLFVIGSKLSCPPDSKYQATLFGDEEIEKLEIAIDQYEGDLEPLRNFILPGGHELAALTHVCRTICRRAERRILAFRKFDEEVDERILRYINRLSDYLFVLARKLNKDRDFQEIIWTSG